MNNIGISLIDPKTGEELQHWDKMPKVITHLGEDREGAIVGSEFKGGALLVDRVCEEPPHPESVVKSETVSFADGKAVVTRTYEELDLAPIKEQKIGAIKSEAGMRILAYCPQYKQANLTAQAAELALTFPDLKGSELPSPYLEAWQAGQEIWNKIKEVRAHSNTLEAEVLGLQTLEELKNWNTYGWPEL